MVTEQIKKLRQEIPAKARVFFLRAIILVAGWNVLYHLLLKPAGIPDAQLTSAVQWGTAHFLSLFYTDISTVGPSVFINGIQSVNIAPECNGLELMVLYLGFFPCLPSTWRRMLTYAIGGLIVIYLLNIVRCSLLATMYYNQHSLADFAHHYAFKMVIYAVVCYGWWLYSKE